MSTREAATVEPDGTHTDTEASPDKRSIILVFVGLMITMLLASLDQMIFSTALPTIVGELNGVNHMVWVTTAYILASTVMMPVYGKLGDLIGRKGLFIGAISIFIVGSVIGGLSHDMTTLIAGRAVQGLGGGGLILLSQAIIADVVPARQRGRYMGAMGGVFALASVCRSPTRRLVHRGHRLALGLLDQHPPRPTRHRERDGISAPAEAEPRQASHRLSGHGSRRDGSDVSDPVHDLGRKHLRLGIGRHHRVDRRLRRDGSGFCLRREACRRTGDPMHLFAQRNFVLTTVAGLIIGIAMFGALAYLPTYIQMVTGKNATEAGLMMIPMMAGLLVASIGSGQLVSKTAATRSSPSSEHPSSLLLWSCSHV